MSELSLKITGNRAVLFGSAGPRLVPLSMRLEGRKAWLKAGGFSFEVTALNMERFRGAFPEVPIEGDPEPESLFLGAAAEALGPSRGRYTPGTPDYPFQARGTALSARAKVFALLGEMGTGKSKVLIDTAGILWCAGEIDAVLIIALKGVHAQWIEEQIPTHMGPAVPWQGAAITKAQKIPPWNRDKLAILSVNFNYTLSKAGFDNCWDFIKSFGGRVLIIVDESHEIKNPSGKMTEAVTALGRRCAYRRIATGTPIGKNLIDALSQYTFLSESILGHRYVTSFKSEYCLVGGHTGWDVIGSKNVEQFWSRVAPYTFRITKEEADLGLPPKNYDRVHFELSPEQMTHYNALKEDMITRMDSGEIMTVTSAIVLLTRLQQVTCGYLSIPGDKENGIPDKIQYLTNTRIDALNRVLEEREGKVVVWARYNEDIKAISEALGAQCVTYYGATSTADRKIAKERFLDPDDVRIFVSNPAAGGTGLNLQGDCRSVIYYSNSFDAINRWQSEDRVHRIGMKHPVTYFDLIARNTIDKKILANLRAKKSISDLAFDDIRMMLAA